MRNIFNSFTGSFFRTIGRILAYAAIGLILAYFAGFINIGNVNAATIDYFSLNNSTDAYFVNCTSKDNCWNYVGATTNTVESVGSNSDKIINAWNSPSVTTTGYGLGIGLSFDVNFSFIAGNYYTVSILVEPMSSVATMYTTNTKLVGTGNSSQNAYNNAGYVIEKSEMRDVDVNFGNAVLNNTFTIITYTFQAKGTGRYAYFNFTTKDTITGSWTYYGYTYSDHGSKAPTTEEIEEALQDQFDSLNNSITEGFEDITGAVDGIGDKVQETTDKVQETNDKLDDLNDNITSTEGADLDSLGDSAGWLPSGPIDSILNLPLTYLNSLTTSLGDTCNPITVTLPFVDEDINLPCLSSIYSEIDGLSVWINTIGVIASAIILFTYLMKLYQWVDDTLTFRENNYIDNWGGV